MAHNENITVEQKEVIRNLYLSGIGEEFIAMQLDIEIPDVIKELDVYKSPSWYFGSQRVFLIFLDKVSNTKSVMIDYGIPKWRTADAKTMWSF